MTAIRQVEPEDETLEEEWIREIAEPRMEDIHGVGATKSRTGPWHWNVTVSVMEFVRACPLELELRTRIMRALRAVPSVTEVAEDDRERWVLQGQRVEYEK